MGLDALLESLRVRVFTVPTDQPEGDGTLTWDSTPMTLVEARGGGMTGIGATYGPAACADLITGQLAGKVLGRPVADIPGSWTAMVHAVRNLGRPGVASMAIAAVDLALWDLKARLLDLPLCLLLGRAREQVPVYGSGGFTTYDDATLVAQLQGWVQAGIPCVKIKIGESWGSDVARDLARAALARRVIGPDVELFVDANGGYDVGEARRVGGELAALDVRWFEEPVSSDNLAGLALLRGLLPMDIAAGEYGYDVGYFARMCAAGAVDCLQADVTRCAGITGWLRAADVAAGDHLAISGHCAPSWHLHVAAAVPNLRHVEYFHDHTRLEGILFDGAAGAAGGAIRPDLSRPGHGLELKEADAVRFETHRSETVHC